MVNEWCSEQVERRVSFAGSVEASQLVSVLTTNEETDVPVGRIKLDFDKRSKSIWRAINRLCDKRVIERYYSRYPVHNRSRCRLRMVSVLDRIVHALETTE